ICVPPPFSAFTTTSTIFSSITGRRPTASALSAGTCTVMSLCRIRIVRYSRFCPSTSRDSFLTTVPAPWWGETPFAPTLNKPRPPLLESLSAKKAGAIICAGVSYRIVAFPGLFGKSPARSELLDQERLAALASAPGRDGWGEARTQGGGVAGGYGRD